MTKAKQDEIKKYYDNSTKFLTLLTVLSSLVLGLVSLYFAMLINELGQVLLVSTVVVGLTILRLYLTSVLTILEFKGFFKNRNIYRTTDLIRLGEVSLTFYSFYLFLTIMGVL